MDTTWDSRTEKNIPKFSLNGETKTAKITSVYDGDTVKACFNLGEQFYIWNCRISGVDTPELRTKNKLEKKHGYLARDELRKLILNKVVTLHCGDFDKYGRLLVNIELSDGTNISKWLTENGYAFEYDGGTKQSWEKYLHTVNNERG